LVATDADNDRINYSYSFTPRADWLKPVIVEDGSDGKLTITFRGNTDKAASYLANVFIHDGYSKHLQSQSWIISVSPNENDIPTIKIIDPIESLRINQGDSFRTAWEATDLNHIIRYELYITNNPSNETEWKTVDSNIPYDTTSYNVDTSNLESGTYKVIAKAVDNQDPAAIGMGVSPEIVLSSTSDKKTETDDVVVLKQPQVVNMSPTSTEEIYNQRVTIKTTIIAGEKAEIDEETILFKLDDKDITDSIKINKISASEYTLIYQPDKDLEKGVHQAEVFFLDTKGNDVTKSWNFTIETEEKSQDTYNIFGYEVAKNIVLIIGIGTLTVILALVAPFVIFSIWKSDTGSEMNKNDRLPPSTPKDETKYVGIEEDSILREKVTAKTEPIKEEEEDVWDMYSAPKPVLTEEKRQQDLQDIQSSEEQSLKPQFSKEETVTEDAPAPQKPTPEPMIPEPVIPEPEIPEADDFEKIFQQIQQTKSEENTEESPVVKE
jgi:hypothetical protein